MCKTSNSDEMCPNVRDPGSHCPDCAGGDPRVVALLTMASAHSPQAPEELEALLEATIPPAREPANGSDGSGPVRRLRTRRVAWAVAAAAVLVLATFLPGYFDGTEPATAATYAAAVNALQSASSLHTRDYHLNRQSGEYELDDETWYLQGHGILQKKYPSLTSRLFKPDVEWTIIPGPRVAVKRPPCRSVSAFFEDFAEKRFLKYADRAKHDPSGDTTIGGAPCRLFVALSDNVTSRPSLSAEEAGLVYLWVDPEGAVRRCENHWFIDGAWVVTSRLEVDFGVKIDPAAFGTQFTKTHRIIEPEKVLGEMFDLRRADLVCEVNGMIVSFHNTVRLPDGHVATTMTLRPSERMRKLIREATGTRLKHTWYLPARLNVYAPGSVTLPRLSVAAELVERSMHVIWLILPLRPYDDRSRDHVKITYHVLDRSEGKQLSKMAGLEWVVWHDQTLELGDRPDRDFASVANSYYDGLEAVAAFQPDYMIIDYGDPLRTRHSRAAAWRPADGGLALRVSRQDFCDAVINAWTGGD